MSFSIIAVKQLASLFTDEKHGIKFKSGGFFS